MKCEPCDRGKPKRLHTLYNFQTEIGNDMWSLIPPDEKYEPLIKIKKFDVSKLKEGYNQGEWFSEGDIKSINQELNQFPHRLWRLGIF